MRKKGLNKRMTAALGVVMLAAVLLAAWLTASPMLEFHERTERQNDLLISIEQGDGTITLSERIAAADVDYYDPAPDSEEMIGPSAAIEEVDAAADGPTVVTGIGILSMDRIGLKLPVVNGVSKAQLQVAVGRVPETAEIGRLGNAVIAGHRSYEYGHFFNRLGEVEAGDIIQYQPKDGAAMEFEVYEILTINPGDQSAFFQPDNDNIITLYTCTPIRTATHRLLVRARLMH